MFNFFVLVILISFSSSLAFADFARKVNYSGRLTETNGKPVVGPVDLQVQFYRVATGGVVIPGIVIPIFDDVVLVQGVFEISIELSPEDMHTVFDGNAVYIQLTDLTHNRFYPRQEFSVTPYALKVPVDGSSIIYNSDGELAVNGTASSAISEITAGTGLSGGGNSGSVSLSLADEGVNTEKIADNAIEASKLADGAVTTIKLAPCTNNDEILKWNGATWACASDEIGANGTGDITSVSSNNGLTGGASAGDVTIGIAANGVSTNRLADEAVTTEKISGNAVTSANLADNAVVSAKISDAAIVTNKIADGAVTLAKLSACINAGEILRWDGTAWACGDDEDTDSGGDVTAVTASDGLSGGGATGDLNIGIAANGVTTNRLADAAVESAKIANAAVINDKLANASVTSDKIINSAVGTDKIADAAVTVGKLAACANADEILKWNGSAWVCAEDEIGASGTGDITGVAAADGLSGGGTTGDLNIGIAANGVTTNRLADAAVETDKIANNAVTDAKLANGAVTLAKIAACANADEILKWNGSAWACAADADTNAGGDVTGVTAADGLSGGGTTGDLNIGIAANGVTTNRLADAAVETAKIANAAVSTDKLANASVSSDKIINAAVGTDKIADAAITVGKLAACANADEILKWNGTAWACAPDADNNAGGDVTEVTANDGLTGGGTTGALSVGIAANGVTTNRLADAAVETAKIANAAVINDKLANASVSSDKIINAAVGTDKIADAAITVGKLAACANADEILKWNGTAWACAADADTNSGGDITGITAGAGLTGSSSSGDVTLSIVDDGITTGKIANAAVINDKLANASVTSDKIINSAVGTDKIADAAVTVGKLAACANADEILKWNGSAWTCGSDANAGGDITGITAGTGLSGGGASGAVTVDLDVSELTTESSVADNDLIPIYDTSAGAHRKMARSDLTSGLESTSNKGVASGYAALNASSKVVQDPASAQTTADVGKIPLSGAGGTIDKDWLPTMAGDAGAGGAKGAVPAPASGDAAAGKFLKADGTWTSPTATSFTQSNGQYIATSEIRARDANGLRLLDDSGTSGLVVDDNANVAIGLGVAANKLHINSGAIGGGITISNTLSPGLTMLNNTTTATATNALGLGLATQAGDWSTTSTSGDVVLRSFSYNAGSPGSLLLGVGNSEKMRITPDGKVGINQGSPGAQLEIKANANTDILAVRRSSNAAAMLVDQNGFIKLGQFSTTIVGATEIVADGTAKTLRTLTVPSTAVMQVKVRIVQNSWSNGGYDGIMQEWVFGLRRWNWASPNSQLYITTPVKLHEQDTGSTWDIAYSLSPGTLTATMTGNTVDSPSVLTLLYSTPASTGNNGQTNAYILYEVSLVGSGADSVQP